MEEDNNNVTSLLSQSPQGSPEYTPTLRSSCPSRSLLGVSLSLPLRYRRRGQRSRYRRSPPGTSLPLQLRQSITWIMFSIAWSVNAPSFSSCRPYFLRETEDDVQFTTDTRMASEPNSTSPTTSLNNGNSKDSDDTFDPLHKESAGSHQWLCCLTPP